MEIELQNLGFSRFTAINICRDERLKKFVHKKNDELVVDYEGLLWTLPNNSIEYRELIAIY